MKLPALQPSGVQWLRWIVLAVLLVCIVLTAVWTRHWHLVNDASQISYAVFLMDHGFAPYRQLVEMNMPGIYMTYWAVLHTVGRSDLAWRIFDAGLIALLTLGMVVIARRSASCKQDWFAGVFAGLMFGLFHAHDGAGHLAQRDLIMAVLLICAYAFLFEALRRHRWQLMFGFGFCAMAAATYKPMPAPFAVLLLVLGLLRWRSLRHRKLLLAGVAGVLGLAAPLLGVLAFLAHYHSVQGFLYVLRVDLPFYSSLQTRPNWQSLAMASITPSLEALLLLTGVIALLRRDTWRDWEYGMVLLGIFIGMFSFYAQQKGFPYHRYPELAFEFLWMAMIFTGALREYGRPVLQRAAVAGLLMAAADATQYAMRAREEAWPEQFEPALAADLDKLGGVNQLQGKVQCLQTIAECDMSLFRLQLVQSTGLIYDFFVFGPADDPPVQKERREFMAQMLAAPPKVLIAGRRAFPPKRNGDEGDYDRLDTWPEFAAFLQQHYRLFDQRKFKPSEGGPLGYRLYVLRSF